MENEMEAGVCRHVGFRGRGLGLGSGPGSRSGTPAQGGPRSSSCPHMNYSLNSLKGVI